MNDKSISIDNVGNDIIGVDITGSGNIIGKNITYTVNGGNIVQIINPPEAFLHNIETLQNMVAEVPIKEFPRENDLDLIEKRIDEVFQMVKSIDNERGMHMLELRANQFQISRVELLLKRSVVLAEQAERYWNVMPRDSDINMYSSKYTEAYSIISEAHKLDPLNTEILIYMAKIQSKLFSDNGHQMRKTLQHIRNILGMPHNDIELFQLAEANYLLSLSSVPMDTDLLQDALDSFSKIGRREWVRKCECMILVVQDDACNAKIWHNRGTALADLGRYQQAVECFDRAIELNPNDANVWNNRGIAFANLGRYQQAVECFDRAIELNPNDANVWNNRGTALHNLSSYQQAIECFDRSAKLNPHDGDAWNGKGISLDYLERYQEAIDCFDKAIKLNSDDADAWYNKGVAFQYLSKNNEAISCYDEALALNPSQVSAWYAKGAALHRLGRYLESVSCHEKALDIDPYSATVWNGKGAALEALKRHEKAEECFSTAKELRESNLTKREECLCRMLKATTDEA